MSLMLGAGELSVTLEPKTARLSFARGGTAIAETAEPPRFVLSGRPAAVRKIEAGQAGIRAHLAGDGVNGQWRLAARKGAIQSTIDLEGVIDWYCQVLRENLAVLTIKADPSIPEWFDDIRVFVAFEMYRSDGEILNDFSHVASFCQDLKGLGVRGGVIVRLVGFQGRFDSRYPYSDPAERLGGAAGMSEAARAVHAGGNRLMAHFNIWGLDPEEHRNLFGLPAYEHVQARLHARLVEELVATEAPWPARGPWL